MILSLFNVKIFNNFQIKINNYLEFIRKFASSSSSESFPPSSSSNFSASHSSSCITDRCYVAKSTTSEASPLAVSF